MAEPGIPNDAGPPPAPPEIPGHQLLRRIGSGTYGEVWLARNSLDTYRAVKIVHRARFADGHEAAYEREFRGIKRFEPVSREHPGLVDILQVGRDDAAGFYYYVMELADDASADRVTPEAAGRVLDENRYIPRALSSELKVHRQLPVKELITLSVRLAEALEFLHCSKLVHRDIKPANIIFVGGEPKLADPGLVVGISEARTMIGTHGFIPPEGPGLPQADIYSLGKVIYEAATGKDRQEFPELPTQLEATPDAPELLALNDVVLKACERDTKQRYQTAKEMAEELRLLERGESVRKRRRKLQLMRATTVAAIRLLAIGLVAALVSHYMSSESVVFDERFTGPQLDSRHWSWGFVTNSMDHSNTWASASFMATNGGLTIGVGTYSKNGLSKGGTAWLKMVKPIATNKPHRITLEFEGAATMGHFFVGISGNARIPQFVHGPLDTNIVWGRVYGEGWNLTNLVPRQTLVLDVDAENKALLLRGLDAANEPVDVFDLSKLPAWYLTIHVQSLTSSGFPPGNATLAVRQVRISKLRTSPKLIGQVVDSQTGQPIKDAMIKNAVGRLLTQSKATGLFVVERDDSGATLRLEKAGYRAESIVMNDRQTLHGVQRMSLNRQRMEFGGVVETYPCPKATAAGLDGICGIEARSQQILAIMKQPNAVEILRLDENSRQFVPTDLRMPDPGIHAAVEVYTNVFGFAVWPGRASALNGEQSSMRLARSDGKPLEFPMDAAFDGRMVWVTDHNTLNGSPPCLSAHNPTSLEPLALVTGSGEGFHGIAWDGEQLWVATLQGEVFSLNRDKLLKDQTLKSARGRGFPGHYRSLAFQAGHLWGLTWDRRAVHKIQISD